MNPPFVRVRGVHADISDRFKALVRSRKKWVVRTLVVLFRVYVKAPEKFDVPPRRYGRGKDGEIYVIGPTPAADWFNFRAVCIRRGEALPDVVEVLMLEYLNRPDRYEPKRPYRRRKPRNRPRGLWS